MSVHTPAPRTAAEVALRDQFATLSAGSAAEAAFADFEQRGLPTRRDEAWHYTDLRAALTRAAPPAPTPGEARLGVAAADLARMPLIGSIRLVIVDGRYVAALSDAAPDGVSMSISE